jgi:signal transduction histidine kinase
MIYNTVRTRLAVKFLQLGLLLFLLSFGVYQLVRPISPFAALVVSATFFALSAFVAGYIISAQELWIFKKLAVGGKAEDGWVDLPPGMNVPVEVGEIRDVLNTLKAKMDEAVLSQRRFLADASHEMRSPITIMKGNIEIALRRERDLAEYRRVLASNLEEINRLEYLLKDLMFLARTDSNQLIVNFAPVMLDELLQTVCDALLPISLKKEITLSLDVDYDPEGYVINGDADRLRQLFTNLVENALRYTPAGGKVDVELGKVSGVCRVDVKDTGIGIPAPELPKIFERFYRVDKARARESGGTGLGLCICKWIVDAHEGDISIESTEGVGTKVTVMLL